jgi:predicted SAM-dependent methyltransferase
MKLNIGCGNVHKEGWINIDIANLGAADIIHDATKPFPYENDSVDFIYSEHFIEHITLADGLSFFKEAYRILKKDGVMRIACPDLDVTIDQFVNDSWREDFARNSIPATTRCEMLDMTMRGWGHLYLYNYEEMEIRLKQCGFTQIERKELYKSFYPELENMETRWASFLVVEAVK